MSRRLYLAKIRVVPHPDFGSLIAHEFQIAHPTKEFSQGRVASDANGQPTQIAALVMVAGIDHSPYMGNPNIVPLPFDSLTGSIGTIATELRLAAKAAIIGLGFDATETNALWINSTPVRDVVTHYGRLNDPDFNVDSFDLYES